MSDFLFPERAAASAAVPEHTPADILAWSETEMERAEPGWPPSIALWRPRGVTVAIGTSQSAETDANPDAIRRDGAGLVRRASGGGAVVLCAGVLCWEAWAECGAGIREAYALLSRPVVDGLRALGVEAFQAGICDIAAGAGADGMPRKLAGTAQLRRRNKILVHGSLLVNADLSLLPRYLPQPSVAPEYRAGRGHGAFCVNLLSLATRIPDNEIGAAARSLGWDVIAPPEKLPAGAEELAEKKYRSDGWNWRRKR